MKAYTKPKLKVVAIEPEACCIHITSEPEPVGTGYRP